MAFKINKNCTGCGACARRCPVGCIEGNVKDRHRIHGDRCIDCGVCGRGCPSGAVEDDRGRIVMRLKKNSWPKPQIEWLYCSGCEFCVNICPTGSLALISFSETETGAISSLEDPKSCIGCGMCLEVCAKGAITLVVSETIAV